jgi:adenylate cyclase
VTHSDAAAAVGVSVGTLRRWLREGVIPEYAGEWTPAAIGKARTVMRLRERGYTLAQISDATADGRLSFGQVLELFDSQANSRTPARAARETGLDLSVVRHVAGAIGLRDGQSFGESDIKLLRYIAAAVDAGLPLEAMLQLTRIYAHAVSQIADAEVRLVHLYVHEPLMRSGESPDEMSQEMTELAGELLPLASGLLDELHRLMLAHFIDQDVVGHMEAEAQADGGDTGRMRVAIAFADLAGYTEMTEERGELEALGAVERFVDAVTATLPDDARVVKTIGDEVMIIGPDPAALTAWAVAFQDRSRRQPLPRIAIHYGHALYRDGDYYGREVNLAARVAARSGAGEVLVTRPIVEASADGLAFEQIPAVALKGFTGVTEIFLARDGAQR